MFIFGKIGLAGLVMGIAPVMASAHSHVTVDVGVDSPCPPPAVVVEAAPVDRVWVEPVYRTVCDHVWREAVTEDRCERVWVPDQFQDQLVGHGRHQWVEHVLVTPAHYEDHHEAIVIQPGHWEDVQRQELVAPGHWEDRRVVIVPERHHDDFAGFFGRFHF